MTAFTKGWGLEVVTFVALLAVCLPASSAASHEHSHNRLPNARLTLPPPSPPKNGGEDSGRRPERKPQPSHGQKRLKDGHDHTDLAAFDKAPYRCVRFGDIVNFSGTHLSTLADYKLVITVNNTEVELPLLHTNDTQLIVRVPSHPELKADQVYPVSLIHKKSTAHYPQTALSIHTCEISTINTVAGHETGEILVLASNDVAASLKQEAETLGLQLVESHALKALNKTILTLKANEANIQAMVTSLRQKFPNADVDLNHHYQSATKPRTYAREKIAWPSTQLCNNTSYKTLAIGIIDGQPDLSHPALLNQNIIVKNFLKKNQQADMQHGTAIASILVGHQPASGINGLLPHINVMAATALRQKKGHLLATTKSIVRAINWLMLEKVRLVNISLSGNEANLILRKVVTSAIKKNMIIFSSAGNNGKAASQSYPAALPGVIAITATDAANRIYRQANQGEYIDFAAPGVDIWTTNSSKQGKYSSGTSYASPYAMAIAAFYLKQNPSLSKSLLYTAMQSGTYDLGSKGRDQTFGWGLVQAPNKVCN